MLRASMNISPVESAISEPDIFSQIAMLYLNFGQRTLYFQFAALTVLICNITSTFHLEIDRVWKVRQSTVTILYYLVRYIPLISVGFGIWGNMSYDIKYQKKACEIWYWVQALLSLWIVEVFAETLMVVRIWALYLGSKRMLFFLMGLFSARFAVSLWGAAVPLLSITYLPWPRDAIPVPGCPLIPPTHVYTVQVCIAFNMTTSIIVFLCLLNQCLARNPLDRQFLGTWRDLLGIRTTRPLMHVLIRDGNVYFLMVLLTEVLVFIMVSSKDPAVTLYAVSFIQIGYSIPATRLVLNLRSTPLSYGTLEGQPANVIPLNDLSRVEFAPRNSSGFESQYLYSFREGPRENQP